MPAIPTSPAPLFIHAPAGGYVNVPPPWTCPESQLSWGGGVPPWNIFTIHSNNYSSNPIYYRQLEIFRATFLNDGWLPNTDAWLVGDELAMVIQDSQGGWVMSSNRSAVRPMDSTICTLPAVIHHSHWHNAINGRYGDFVALGIAFACAATLGCLYLCCCRPPATVAPAEPLPMEERAPQLEPQVERAGVETQVKRTDV